MPNWCANRLCVSGREEDMVRVKALMEGGGYQSYACAAAEGIQLFLAGCAGLLRPVPPEPYLPYPQLTGGDRYPSYAAEGELNGAEVSENQAFTQWLICLREQVILTDTTCTQLHALWLGTGLMKREWDTLSAEQQTIVCALWQKKQDGWPATLSTRRPDEAWNRLCRGEPVTHQAEPFDMLTLCPPRLDVEINGYNGRLLSGVPDGFSETVERCGTKWPHAHDLNITWSDATSFDADFDTPWSPPSEAVLVALSSRYGVTVEHWYAEAGCDLCGYALYRDGERLETCCDSLEWSEEEDENGFREITGPAWILNNLAGYGG
ncbi:DUF1281 domain-containing protein [Pantoea cypripedii]|uniref:DUF1281 domain-containing protein n=1 Tax=Pantoea cypripedii TaxID=55209 RepID=UPI002FC7CAA8